MLNPRATINNRLRYIQFQHDIATPKYFQTVLLKLCNIAKLHALIIHCSSILLGNFRKSPLNINIQGSSSYGRWEILGVTLNINNNYVALSVIKNRFLIAANFAQRTTTPNCLKWIMPFFYRRSSILNFIGYIPKFNPTLQKDVYSFATFWVSQSFFNWAK